MNAQNEAGTPKADWYEDPARRHQFRYWDGTAWTDHVADDGKSSLDPLQGHATPKADPVVRSAPAADLCKAFQAGRCVVQGRDTGPCDGDPSAWQRCGVVVENKKYGSW